MGRVRLLAQQAAGDDPDLDGAIRALSLIHILQWPCPSAEHPGTPILHMGEFAQGLGAFSTPDYQPSAELPDAEYPLVMMTGRILYPVSYTHLAVSTVSTFPKNIASCCFLHRVTTSALAADALRQTALDITPRRIWPSAHASPISPA